MRISVFQKKGSLLYSLFSTLHTISALEFDNTFSPNIHKNSNINKNYESVHGLKILGSLFKTL